MLDLITAVATICILISWVCFAIYCKNDRPKVTMFFVVDILTQAVATLVIAYLVVEQWLR